MKFDRTNWRTEKILSPQQAAATAAILRKQGRRLVTTNGSFDLLHIGHLDQLEQARAQGDVLFVGVNTDTAVAQGKGPNRPLVPQEARVALVSALMCVDYVLIMPGSYAEEPMRSLLPTVQPHVHTNGEDYGEPSKWVEWPLMKQLGIAGHVVLHRNDFSTSALVEKLRSQI